MTDEEKVIIDKLEDVLQHLEIAMQHSKVILHKAESAHHNLKLIQEEIKEKVAAYRRQLLKENPDGV